MPVSFSGHRYKLRISRVCQPDSHKSLLIFNMLTYLTRYDQSEAQGFVGIDSTNKLIVVSFMGTNNLDNLIAE
jgi:hypothetical protein